MSDKPGAAGVREHLVRALEADLVGPFDPESGAEILPLAPSRWYLTGFLAPQGVEDEDPDDSSPEAGDDEDDPLREEAAERAARAVEPGKPRE